MSKSFVFLAMIFCHIIDDYTLQGILASMKQERWWKENASEHLYEYDYLMALAMHSISWSFSIMFPIAAFYKFNIKANFVIIFIINALIHAFVDDLKANKLKINLITDQLAHIIQLVLTFKVLI